MHISFLSSRLNIYLLSFLISDLLIDLNLTDRGDRQCIFHLLVHLRVRHKGQGYARLKPGARSQNLYPDLLCGWQGQPGELLPFTPRHPSRNRDHKFQVIRTQTGTLILDVGIPRNGLTHCATTLVPCLAVLFLLILLE